jgi:hypothetical protein
MKPKITPFILTDAERDFIAAKGFGNMTIGLKFLLKEAGFDAQSEPTPPRKPKKK